MIRPLKKNETCAHCGGSFEPKRSTQRFCSRGCQVDSRQIPEKPISCQFCGTALTPRKRGGPYKKSCSVRCRNRGHTKARRMANPEESRSINRKSYLRHKISRIQSVLLRSHASRVVRSRTGKAELKAIKSWWLIVKSTRRTKCYWCQLFIPGKKATQDHIMPIKLGGQHSMSNLCVSCRQCNSAKRAQPARTWASSNLLCPTLDI